MHIPPFFLLMLFTIYGFCSSDLIALVFLEADVWPALFATMRKSGSLCSYPAFSTILTMNIRVVVESCSLKTQSNSKENNRSPEGRLQQTWACLTVPAAGPSQQGIWHLSRTGLESELNNSRRKKPKVWLSELHGFHSTFSILAFAPALSIFTNM